MLGRTMLFDFDPIWLLNGVCLASAFTLGLLLGRHLCRKAPIVDRREQPFIADQSKFATQRTITYVLLGVFIGVSFNVILFGTDQSERSIIIQTMINLVLLAVGFWLGSSKQSQDQTQAAIERDHTVPSKSNPTETVHVEADKVEIKQRD